MSEIKCNKLEITSLRQCDSIKIQGNIGPCIIEGPARQDSCQACQPCCSYWIWPVTHTQISPVKITGYIDFLFFICECLWVSLRVLMWGCGSWCMCVCVFSACIRYVCVCVCKYSYVCVLHMHCMWGCAHMCGAVEQDINQVWETVQGWKLQPHLELQTLQVGFFRCWGELWAKHTSLPKPHDHSQLLLLQ